MRLTKIYKKSFSTNDMQELYAIPLNNPESMEEHHVYETLRKIRIVNGKIISTLNTFSYIYKSFMQNVTVDQQESSRLINDLKNLDKIKQRLQEIKFLYNKTIQEQPYTTSIKNLYKIVSNQIDYINNIYFSEQQKINIQNMAKGQQEKSGKVKEIDVERMRQFLNSSIYSISSDPRKTLRVVREILQNAVDAVNKRHKQGGQIRIYTSSSEDNYMDLVIEDNGVGMDWQTLSNKFFVYFASGKENDDSAAGEYGIAKALIQETPKEGWSMQTNDIHSGTYDKNMFFANQEQYKYPALETKIDGVVLTLYNLPSVSRSYIVDLAKKYSSMSNLDIMVNNEHIAPLFTVDSLKRMDSASDIASVVAENSSEEQTMKNELNHLMDEQVGSLEFEVDKKRTAVKFYLNKLSSNEFGNFYVFLNGQYQFEKSSYVYLQRCNIVCSIKTNARPGTDAYPVDPGRENLKEPYKTQIYDIESQISESLKKIFENELFKDGMDIDIYNENKGGIDFVSNSGKYNTYAARNIENALSAVQMNNDIASSDPEASAKRMRQIIDSLTEITQEPLTDDQSNIVNRFMESVQQEQEKNVDVKKMTEDLIDEIDSQFAVVVQKSYVNKDRIDKKKHLTNHLTTVWNKTLKILGKRVMQSRLRKHLEDKSIVGGVIYSDECIGVSIPPRKQRHNYLTLVNPINAAAIIETELFEKQIYELETDLQNINENIKDETPINKFTNFIYHIATHELAHAMFPGSSLDEWHNNITIVELLCQSEYNKVRDLVKEYMQPLRRDMKQIITMVKKEKKAKSKVKANVLFNLKKLSKRESNKSS